MSDINPEIAMDYIFYIYCSFWGYKFLVWNIIKDVTERYNYNREVTL